MDSVTGRIRKIKQPYGGYLNKDLFKIREINDGNQLNENENIHASTVGLAVDYLTRFMMGSPAEKAFQISLKGAECLAFYGKNRRAVNDAKRLLQGIKGLDDKSVVNACKLSGYDVCYRAGIEKYKPVGEINPNKGTIENIRIMVNRSLAFWEEYGPIVMDGFTLDGAYTDKIGSGDGDYLTKDTLWDFKVSKEKRELRSQHTLQLLVYYIMGCHSYNKKIFFQIEKLGIYNPRKNKVYLVEINSIPIDTRLEVSKEVIGYK